MTEKQAMKMIKEQLPERYVAYEMIIGKNKTRKLFTVDTVCSSEGFAQQWARYLIKICKENHIKFTLKRMPPIKESGGGDKVASMVFGNFA